MSMNELLLLVPAALAMCVIVYWVGFLPNGEVEPEPEPKPEMPSEAELKKMTKAKLVELAGELGIEIDSKKKKAEIVEEIESKR